MRVSAVLSSRSAGSETLKITDRNVLSKPWYFFLRLQCFRIGTILKTLSVWRQWTVCLSGLRGVYCGSNNYCPLTCDGEPIAEWLTARWKRVGPHSELGGTQIQLNTISDTKCWVTIFHLNTSLFLELQNPQKYTKPIILFIYAWSNARCCWLLLVFQTNACHMQNCMEGMLSV